MPTIHILHPHAGDDVRPVLRDLCADMSAAAGLPADKVWAFWHPIEASMAWCPNWNGEPRGGPVVRIFCRRSHAAEKVRTIVEILRSSLAAALGCGASTVFVQVIRVDDEEVFNVC